MAHRKKSTKRRKLKKYQDYLDKLGANVRRERVARNITQEKLAELTDLHPRTIQAIERAEFNILFTTAARIQKALNCPWEKLIPSRFP